VIDITPWPRITPIVAALSRAGYLIGFRTIGEARHWAFDATAEHSASRHELDNYRALLAPLGIAGTRIPQARERFRRLSAMRGNDGPPLLAFHPWASGFRSTLREWPEERWAALGCKVIAEGYDVAITGSPADAIRAHRLSSLIGYPGRVHVTAGASLVATARLFSRTHGVVSVNTGAMHLAAALDTPLVALHGPTDPRRWGPLSEKARVIGPGKAEGGAYLNLGFEYPRDPPDCMRMIAVEEVLQGLREILEDNGVCQAGTGTGLRALVDAAD
jgi:ADP-heptose:LPS heptosyltransferase